MDTPNEATLIRAIDLFCGAGGSSLGARAAGVQIVAGFDIWNLATDTFHDNFPFAHTYIGDLRHISTRLVASELERVSLLLASPECTSHTHARGRRRPSEDSRMTAFLIPKFARTLKP